MGCSAVLGSFSVASVLLENLNQGARILCKLLCGLGVPITKGLGTPSKQLSKNAACCQGSYLESEQCFIDEGPPSTCIPTDSVHIAWITWPNSIRHSTSNSLGLTMCVHSFTLGQHSLVLLCLCTHLGWMP